MYIILVLHVAIKHVLCSSLLIRMDTGQRTFGFCKNMLLKPCSSLGIIHKQPDPEQLPVGLTFILPISGMALMIG